MNDTTSSIKVEDVKYFQTHAALRAAHSELYRRLQHSSKSNIPAFLDEIRTFVQCAQASGVLLDRGGDRSDAQNLLDYWATVLSRAGEEYPDTTLADFDPSRAPVLADDLCPYLGLEAFQPDQHHLFFGRQRLVEELVAKVRDNRLLAVVGPSGSGKSSLVLAGLVPALKAGKVRDSDHWHYYPPIVPGAVPLVDLARLLQPPDVNATVWIERQSKDFRHDVGHLAHLVRAQYERPILLIVDQFEEVFTQCTDLQARDAFVRNLLGLAQIPDVRHTVVLTMRSDFEEYVARLPMLRERWEQAQVRVTPLDAGELREAIEKPAQQVGLKFEDGIIDDLVKELLGEPAGLPLLQFTLLKLWEKRERNRVSWKTYQGLGGGRLALARSADSFYENLLPQDQLTTRRLLLRLIRLGEGLEVLRNRVHRETLYQLGIPREQVDQVLHRLIEARLVRETAGATPANTQVEVVHEALVRNWPRLVGWIEEERVTLRRRQLLQETAAQWEARGREASVLMRGRLLEDARAYDDLTQLEAAFIQSSQEAEDAAEKEREATRRREVEQAQALAREQEQRAEVERQKAKEQKKAKRNLGMLALGLAVLAGAALWFGILAMKRGTLAMANARQAETKGRLATAREQAAAARGGAAQTRTGSVLLAMHAVQQTAADGVTTPEAWGALQQTLQAVVPPRFTLAGHVAPVRSVAFSPNDKLLATASEDRTVKVWDTDSGQPLFTLEGHTAIVNGVAFSPDGTHLVTAGEDGAVILWEARAGAAARPLNENQSHRYPVTGVVFSPQGELFATTGVDGTTILWKVGSWTQLRSLKERTVPVRAVAFSPDGSFLATASEDGTAIMWQVYLGDELLSDPVIKKQFSLMGHASPVTALAFSRNGKYLATASEDGKVRMWDAFSGKLIQSPLSAHNVRVTGVTFSADATRLFTVSTDTMVRVWDTSALKSPPTALPSVGAHAEGITAIVLNHQGTILATASKDRTVRLWTAEQETILRSFPLSIWPAGVAFDSAEISLAMVSKEVQWQRLVAKTKPEVYVWNMQASAPLLDILTTEHTEPIAAAAFSPDRKRLAIASADKTASVWEWDAETRKFKFRRVLSAPGKGHTAPVIGVTFSLQDGSRIATASEDKTVLVWDTHTGKHLTSYEGHAAPVRTVAFSPRGTYLATASLDATAMVWDARTDKPLPRPLKGHTAPVRTVTFSPDESLLVTTSDDKTAKVWNIQTEKILHSLEGHPAPVSAAAFSPEGKCPATGQASGTCVATASADGTVKVWDVSTGEELFSTVGHSEAVVAMAFSTNGRHLDTVSADATVRSYVLDIQDLMDEARKHVRQDALTLNECKRLLHVEKCPHVPSKP